MSELEHQLPRAPISLEERKTQETEDSGVQDQEPWSNPLTLVRRSEEDFHFSQAVEEEDGPTSVEDPKPLLTGTEDREENASFLSVKSGAPGTTIKKLKISIKTRPLQTDK